MPQLAQPQQLRLLPLPRACGALSGPSSRPSLRLLRERSEERARAQKARSGRGGRTFMITSGFFFLGGGIMPKSSVTWYATIFTVPLVLTVAIGSVGNRLVATARSPLREGQRAAQLLLASINHGLRHACDAACLDRRSPEGVAAQGAEDCKVRSAVCLHMHMAYASLS